MSTKRLWLELHFEIFKTNKKENSNQKTVLWLQKKLELVGLLHIEKKNT